MTRRQFTTSPEMVRRMSPDIRAHLMEQCAAAKTYINAAIGNADKQKVVELHAFMAIFHPEVSEDRVRKLSRALR